MSTEELIVRLDERIKDIQASLFRIERALYGNGSPGMLDRVSSLERWRAWLTGISAVLGAMGSALLLYFRR